MRKTLALVLAITALVFAAQMQGRPTGTDDETQLIQLERSWNQAEMGGDAGAITSLFEDSLVYVDYDGSLMTKAQYLRSVAEATSRPDHMYDEGMKVHVYGSAGIVTGVYRETGGTKGKPYVRRARFTDTWIKQSGQWKCVASQSTLIQ